MTINGQLCVMCLLLLRLFLGMGVSTVAEVYMSKVSDELLEGLYTITDKGGLIDTDTRDALERLIASAMTDTDQGARIADLLLSWSDADGNGGLDLQSFWRIDHALVLDSLSLITWISHNWRYPEQLGYGDQFRAIRKQWRSAKPMA
jgi:hypothetical protein